MRKGAIGQSRGWRADAPQRWAQDRAGAVAADVTRKIFDAPAPGQTAAEQRDRDRVDNAGLGDRNHRRGNVLVTQRRRELGERLCFTSHDYSAPLPAFADSPRPPGFL